MTVKEVIQRVLFGLVLLAGAAFFGWLGYTFLKHFMSGLSLFS